MSEQTGPGRDAAELEAGFDAELEAGGEHGLTQVAGVDLMPADPEDTMAFLESLDPTDEEIAEASADDFFPQAEATPDFAQLSEYDDVGTGSTEPDSWRGELDSVGEPTEIDIDVIEQEAEQIPVTHEDSRELIDA